MKKLLKPDMKVKSIFEIPLDNLYERGFHNLIIDLDNTVTEWNGMDVCDSTAGWFQELRKRGFNACLVSNNLGERVFTIARRLGIPSINKAAKPRRRAFRQALDILDSGKYNTAVVGDQIFTDVLGGNRMGLFTILVDPINPKEFVGTRIMRIFERLVFKEKSLEE